MVPPDDAGLGEDFLVATGTLSSPSSSRSHGNSQCAMKEVAGGYQTRCRNETAGLSSYVGKL